MNLLEKLTLAVTLASCSLSAAAQERWVLFYETENFKHYYDSESIGDNFLWVDGRTTREGLGGHGYQADRAKFTVDCKNKRISVSEGVIYDEYGVSAGRSKAINSGDIFPDSLGESIYNIVCVSKSKGISGFLNKFKVR